MVWLKEEFILLKSKKFGVWNNMKYLSFFFLFISFYASALTMKVKPYDVFVNIKDGKVIASVCKNNECSDESKVFSDMEANQVSLMDMNDDHRDEIQVQINGNPDSVSYLYQVKNGHIQAFDDINGNQLIFSSYHKRNGLVITHTSGMPAAIDTVYKIVNRDVLQPIVQDKCIDCGEIQRTDLLSHEHYLVTDVANYFDRKPIIRTITANRSYLLDVDGQRKKGYLIKGDQCQVLGYSGDDNQYTYIRYGKNNIKAYVFTKDLK
jgi:hypothetical protein